MNRKNSPRNNQRLLAIRDIDRRVDGTVYQPVETNIHKQYRRNYHVMPLK